MKRLSKILCAVLVLAVLCSSIVFLVGAEGVTPTATVEDITGNPASINSEIVLDATVPSFAQFEGDYTISKVTAGDNTYLQMTALKDGKLGQNFQFQIFEPSAAVTAYDASKSEYGIYEFDIASEGELADMFVRSNVRKYFDEGKTDADGNPELSQTYTAGAVAVKFRDLGLEPDTFYHIVFVQDYMLNKYHVFVNGVQKTEGKLFSDEDHALWVDGNDPTKCIGIRSGIKIESDTTNISSIKNSTLLLDNLRSRLVILDGPADVAELANENYSDAYALPVIPDIAKVNGNVYNSLSELNAVLSYGVEKNVELLRNTTTGVVINCPAKLTTNTFNFTTGDAVTNVVDNNDGTHTIYANFRGSLTYVEDDNYQKADTRLDIPGNLLDANIRQNKFDTDGTHFTKYYADYVGSSSPFHAVVVNRNFLYEDGTYATNPNNAFFSGDVATADYATFNVGEGASGYYVFDLDLATYGDILPLLDIDFVVRNNDATTNDSGESNNNHSDAHPGGLVVDSFVNNLEAWNHLTFVGDIAANKVYVYANGKLVSSSTEAYSATKVAAVGGTEVVVKGFRIEVGRNFNTGYGNKQVRTIGENFLFDNGAIRFYDNAESANGLAEAIANDDITSWANYTNGRGGELLPELITINGETYRNANLANRVLTNNEPVTAELVNHTFTPLKVHANGTINTNGFENAFVALEGCTFTQEGNIIKSTAPFIASDAGVYTSADFSTNSAKQVAPAGYIHGGAVALASTEEFSAHVGTYNGNKYYKLTAIKDGGVAGHVQWIWNSAETSDTVDTKGFAYVEGLDQYAVMEFDIATETQFISFDIVPNIRVEGGGSGTDFAAGREGYVVMSDFDVPVGEFVHLTLVYDMTNNQSTYFINDKIVAQHKTIVDTAHENWKNGTTPVLFAGFKFQMHSSYKQNNQAATPLVNGATTYLDNANSHIIKGGDGTLAEAIANGDLSRWSGYADKPALPELPVLATVDGVPYSGKTALEAAIHGNFETHKVVKFQRNTPCEINVKGKSIIYTNEFDVNLAYSSGVHKDLGDGAVQFDADYIRNFESEKIATTAVLSLVKSGHPDNMITNLGFNSNTPNKTWNIDGTRQNNLYTNTATGDKFYMETLNTVEDESKYGSNEYSEFDLGNIIVDYEDGKSKYVVADFNYAQEKNDRDYLQFPIIIRTASSGASWPMNNVVLRDIVGEGNMAHITIVYDLTANNANVFVNNEYKMTYENAIYNKDRDDKGNKLSFDSTGDQLMLDAVRFTAGGLCKRTFYMNDISVRLEVEDSGNDQIANAILNKDITAWDGNILDANYHVPSLAPLATIDGTDYYSATEVTNALKGEKAETANVEFFHDASGEISIDTNASIETHGLDLNLKAVVPVSGFYEFVDEYGHKRMANIKYVKTAEGTLVNYALINAVNYGETTVEVAWYTDLANDECEYYYYEEGTVIVPPATQAYIIGGKVAYTGWFSVGIDDGGNLVKVEGEVTDFGIANKNADSPMFVSEFLITDEDATFAAPSSKGQLSINSEFILTYLVNSEYTTDGTQVTIDGVSYQQFVSKFAANQVGNKVVVEFRVYDDGEGGSGKSYIQRVEISVVDYALALFQDEAASLLDKQVMYAALNYANEAYKLLNGAEEENIALVLTDYAQYAPAETALDDVVDTTALKDVVVSAAMKLDSAPSFVLQMKRGTKGKVTFSYDSLGEAQTPVVVTYDATAAEVLVALNGFKVYDIHETVTVVIETEGGDTITGSYNLATYASKLGDASNAFAKALNAYATVAKEHKLAE